MNVIVKKSYVKIYDSYQLSKNDFDTCLDYIEDHYTTDVFKERTRKSLKREWAVHNFCYNLNILRDHTADVDFEADINKYLEKTYIILGKVAMWFIN